ncbi:MAG: glycosyltransferase family 2 protein [Patescibacteria group bacterium]|jgi:hypothetical protein
MKFSIIIPVYSDPKIKQCLESITNLDYPKHDYEVIVVDNNPEPVLHNCIHEPIPGSYQARNTGLEQARGEYLAFTDSDCTVDPQWLYNIEQLFIDETIDAVMGYATGNNANKIATYEQQMYEDNIGKFVGEKKLRRIDTRNFAIKRNIYEKLGGFNTRLDYGGDMEYGARAHQAGFNIIFAKNVVVTHSNETNLPKLLQKRIRQNKGNMLITQIHDEQFVQEYFPHLLRYISIKAPQPPKGGDNYSPCPLGKGVRGKGLGLRSLLSIYSKLTFWLSGFICNILPGQLGYFWFKLQNVVAMRLGQMQAPKSPKGDLSNSPFRGSGGLAVSIIILSWNSKDITQACIDSILKNVKNIVYEIILIDNGSKDGSAEMIKERYINNPNIVAVFNQANQGYATGNNQGYKLAKGKYILMLNSDTVVPEQSIENMLNFLERYQQYGAATTALLNKDGSTQYFMHRRFPTLITLLNALLYKRWHWLKTKRVEQYLYLDKDFKQDFDIEQAAGACLMIRREAIVETHHDVSLLDTQHFPLYYNDVDLCWRIHHAGWKIRCLTNYPITHLKGVSVKKLPTLKNLKAYLPAVYWYWKLH